MSLSSESIHKKEFHIVFKGYKPEEVDKFLDLLAMEFEGMQKKIREMEERIDTIKYEGDTESSKMKKVIQEALISAHRMAEDIKQKAKIEAEEMMGKKKIEEEQELRRLRDEKVSLESGITSLRKEYSEFKQQISRFADDFKQKMASVGDGKLMDSLEAAENESKRQNSSSGQETAIGEKQPGSSSNIREEVVYKHARKDGRDSSLEENDLKDLAALTDEMLEKLDDGESDEKSGTDPVKEDNAGPEDKEDEEELKKDRKKIDIANPDIINDFFKTDD